MNIKKVYDLNKGELANQKVFLRVDFNVPLDIEGNVVNDERIRKSIPTIQYLLEAGASVVIATHIGRPKGQAVDTLRTNKVAQRLSELIGKEVQKVANCIGSEVEQAKQALQGGQVLMLENVRFHEAEKKNDPEFAKQLAQGCDLFVEDAFASVHRAHASTVGVAKILPAYAGLLVAKEVEMLSPALEMSLRPFVLVIGGAKIDTKIGVIKNFINKADRILIGGGLANTFLKAQGKKIGKSLCEDDKLDLAREILAQAGDKIKLPTDVIVAENPDSRGSCVRVDEVPENMMSLDIGLSSAQNYAQEIQNAQMVIWNGPVGLFEQEAFAEGSRQIAQALVNMTGQSIVGGGDTIEAIARFNIPEEKFSCVSTGGGSMIEFLEGKNLPGIDVLR